MNLKPHADIISLEAMNMVVRRMISSRALDVCIDNVQARMMIDQLNDLVVELNAVFASKQQQRRVKQRDKVRFPADWWQAFKARWFPAWALRRWPSEYVEIETLAIDEVTHVCPHLPMPMGKSIHHLRWLAGATESEDQFMAIKMKRFIFALTQRDFGGLGYEVSPRVEAEAKRLLEAK